MLPFPLYRIDFNDVSKRLQFVSNLLVSKRLCIETTELHYESVYTLLTLRSQPPRLFVSTLCARFPLSFISPSWEPQRDWKRSSFAQKLSPWVVAAKCNDTQTKMITSANGVNDNVSRIINTQSYCHAQESLPKQRTIIGNVLNLLGTIKEILTLWEIFVWKVGSQLLQLFPWFEQ